jgi:hypothetical protein
MFVSVHCVGIDSFGSDGRSFDRGRFANFSDLLTLIVNHNNLRLSGLGDEETQQLEVLS